MHKLIIASSITLQISATLHKLLPVRPTGHMLHVRACTFLMYSNASSYQQLTAFEEKIIYMYST